MCNNIFIQGSEFQDQVFPRVVLQSPSKSKAQSQDITTIEMDTVENICEEACESDRDIGNTEEAQSEDFDSSSISSHDTAMVVPKTESSEISSPSSPSQELGKHLPLFSKCLLFYNFQFYKFSTDYFQHLSPIIKIFNYIWRKN